MAILAGLLAYCFNENKIFAVLKRQAYNCSIRSHIIHVDAMWLGMPEQVGRALAAHLHHALRLPENFPNWCSGFAKLTPSVRLPHMEVQYYFNNHKRLKSTGRAFLPMHFQKVWLTWVECVRNACPRFSFFR